MIKATLLVAMLATWPLAALAQPVDPAALMRSIASRPFRYGGALQGTVPGLETAIAQPPIHLSIGLDAPSAAGALTGDAILFTADRRLVASGAVSGQLDPGPTAGTRRCTLHLALPLPRPDHDVTLSGICTADTLSGEIVTHGARAGLLTRLVSWWGDSDVSGRYWLTPASFDPGP